MRQPGIVWRAQFEESARLQTAGKPLHNRQRLAQVLEHLVHVDEIEAELISLFQVYDFDATPGAECCCVPIYFYRINITTMSQGHARPFAPIATEIQNYRQPFRTELPEHQDFLRHMRKPMEFLFCDFADEGLVAGRG